MVKKLNHRWSLRLLFALWHYKKLLLFLLLLRGRERGSIRGGRVAEAWNCIRRWRWKQFHWSDHLHEFKLKKRSPWQQRLSASLWLARKRRYLQKRCVSGCCGSHNDDDFLRLSSATSCSGSTSLLFCDVSFSCWWNCGKTMGWLSPYQPHIIFCFGVLYFILFYQNFLFGKITTFYLIAGHQ